jgi:ketosteroid isomerase-like protein
MDKSKTNAVLRQDTEWTNQKLRQYWDKTQNGQTRDRGSIETRHKMDKPETQATLGQDTEWTNQRYMQY